MNTRVEKNKALFLSTFKGAMVAVAITLVLILIFAVIIRFVNISDAWIFPVNQVIKVVSLICGMCVFLKSNKSNGFLKGLLIGVTYYLLSYLVFSILQGDFSVSVNNLYDLLLTTLSGGLIGAICVNIGK